MLELRLVQDRQAEPCVWFRKSERVLSTYSSPYEYLCHC